VLRRELLTALIAAVATQPAWGSEAPSAITTWLCAVRALREALAAAEIDQAAWIEGVERANAIVPLEELAAHIDLDRMRLPNRPALSAFEDLESPEHDGFTRVFGMRRGATLLPHVHNGMVSTHLVIAGAFHVRTHDRVEDLDDAIVLRPRRDEIVRPGGMITMTDADQNHHWLVAVEDRSFTLDVAVFGLPHTHRQPARFENTVLIDPTAPADCNGLIVAPILDVASSIAKFAA